MLVKQKLCKTTRDYNEDYIVANENYAFVLDGATGLKKILTLLMPAGMYKSFRHI